MLDAPASRNLLYVLPALLIYALFVFLPIIAAVAISFTAWNGISRPVIVGLENYLNLFADDRFYTSLKNNAAFIIFYAVLPLLIGICFAAIISVVGNRERLAVRTLLFMPYIMPTAVLGIIWQWLYNPAFGPINQGLRLVGLGGVALPWLGHFTFALPAVGFVATWYFF